MKERGKIGLGDLGDFEAKPAQRRDPSAADRAAEEHGFTSREAGPKIKSRRNVRVRQRYDAQINIRARPEDIDFFQEIAAQRGVAYGRLFQELCDRLRKEGAD